MILMLIESVELGMNGASVSVSMFSDSRGKGLDFSLEKTNPVIRTIEMKTKTKPGKIDLFMMLLL